MVTGMFMFYLRSIISLAALALMTGSLCERRDVNTEMLMSLPEVHYISGSPGSNDRVFV